MEPFEFEAPGHYATRAAAAAVLQQQAGIEAIPHVTCKDKNLLALQAEILGAHALGIRNVLLVTGDPPSIGLCKMVTCPCSG